MKARSRVSDARCVSRTFDAEVEPVLIEANASSENRAGSARWPALRAGYPTSNCI